MFLRLFIVAFAALLVGCAHYEVSDNAPLTLGGRIPNSLDKAGTMTVSYFNNIAPEFYEGKDNLFVLTFHPGLQHPELAKYQLRGIDFKFEQVDYLSTCGGIDACRRTLVNNNGLTRIEMKPNNSGVDVGHSPTRDVFLRAQSTLLEGRPTISNLRIEFNKYMASSKLDFERAKAEKSVTAFKSFLKKYPTSNLVPIATRNLLELLSQHDSAQEYWDAIKDLPLSLVGHKELTEKFFVNYFSVQIKTKNSAPRSITEKSLLSSMAGSCIDVKKSVTVSPRRTLDFTNNISLDLTFTLRRKYTPHQLAEDDDPLYAKKVYKLDKGSGFVQTEDIDYPCVLSDGRFYAAGLSLLGKLFGKGTQETGIKTTLTKMEFDLKVERVQ